MTKLIFSTLAGVFLFLLAGTLMAAPQPDNGRRDASSDERASYGGTDSDQAEDAADSLNELLRGEMSAVETYSQALAIARNEDGADFLRKAREDHRNAVERIRSHVKTTGQEPSQSSGAWGSFAQAVTGSAKLFGNVTALRALKQGEEHGLDEYQDALEDEDVPQSFKKEIRDKFIPQQRDHISKLDELIERAG